MSSTYAAMYEINRKSRKNILFPSKFIVMSFLKVNLHSTVVVKKGILISSNDGPQIHRVDVEAGEHTQSLALKGLAEGRAYDVWVTASTALGEGPETRRVSAAPSQRGDYTHFIYNTFDSNNRKTRSKSVQPFGRYYVTDGPATNAPLLVVLLTYPQTIDA